MSLENEKQKIHQHKALRKERKFKEKDEREKVLNRCLVISISLLFLTILIMTFIQYQSQGMNVLHKPFLLVMYALTIAFAAVDVTIVLKNPANEQLKHIATAGFLLIYTMAMIGEESTYLKCAPLIVLVNLVLFYREKIVGLYAIVSFLPIVICYAIGGLQGIGDLAETFIYLACLAMVYRCTRIGHNFNHDALHSIQDEQKVQMAMLDEVLHIAEAVKEGAIESDQLVIKLADSIEVVGSAVKEITASTQVTADSIQEQTVMTSTIQESIADTVELSKRMVRVAVESGNVISDNLDKMNSLKEHANKVAQTNKVVAKSMDELHTKTQEVKDITSLIFSISNQTNLLALNASIESARAGEAGRGFAVVAEQIRQLAEQTREATENISKIIEALNEEATNAMVTVKENIEVSNEQGVLIADTSTSFVDVSNNMKTLSEDIDGVDKKLEELANSNQIIVDNISQLSAASEEVFASAQQGEEVSEVSKEDSSNVRELLDQLIVTAKGLDKYLVK
ncbi:methyl-accepting chemotaxis protein [Anaerosporobacter sp.]|uniref:methyl-accepting chemotaxis protein n=1 Tax=Anaerosporobacter sp. TaxID=1872529 RepID=UPI00286F2DDA|nr:methyl-accepting chemotaxis protein [Anaerosporobacter sp.]